MRFTDRSPLWSIVTKERKLIVVATPSDAKKVAMSDGGTVRKWKIPEFYSSNLSVPNSKYRHIYFDTRDRFGAYMTESVFRFCNMHLLYWPGNRPTKGYSAVMNDGTTKHLGTHCECEVYTQYHPLCHVQASYTKHKKHRVELVFVGDTVYIFEGGWPHALPFLKDLKYDDLRTYHNEKAMYRWIRGSEIDSVVRVRQPI